MKLAAPYMVAIFCLLYSGNAQTALLDDILAPLVGTQWVATTPQFQSGALIGCQMTFVVVLRDFQYKQGGYVIVNGGVALMQTKGSLGQTLKVVVEDVNPGSGNLIPAAPTSAYLIDGYKTSKDAIVGSFSSDIPGGIFVVFDGSKTFESLLNSITQNKLLVAFAREADGADVQFKVDVNVEQTDENGKRIHSDKPVTRFLDCTSKLLELPAGQ